MCKSAYQLSKMPSSNPNYLSAIQLIYQQSELLIINPKASATWDDIPSWVHTVTVTVTTPLSPGLSVLGILLPLQLKFYDAVQQHFHQHRSFDGVQRSALCVDASKLGLIGTGNVYGTPRLCVCNSLAADSQWPVHETAGRPGSPPQPVQKL